MEMKRMIELGPPADSRGAYQKFNRVFNDAYRLNEQRSHWDALIFIHRLRRLEIRLFDFACAMYAGKHWQRISGRLLKYYKEILTF
jgi:hypothetical protein